MRAASRCAAASSSARACRTAAAASFSRSLVARIDASTSPSNSACFLRSSASRRPAASRPSAAAFSRAALSAAFCAASRFASARSLASFRRRCTASEICAPYTMPTETHAPSTKRTPTPSNIARSLITHAGGSSATGPRARAARRARFIAWTVPMSTAASATQAPTTTYRKLSPALVVFCFFSFALSLAGAALLGAAAAALSFVARGGAISGTRPSTSRSRW
mmetsp:Transcript_11495/g.30466  ORF Transcript_11495/g.30466 Transcript_11495/m.30466 type:complete len:222 (+) Transcript_11495:1872-2537(+)